MILSKKLLGKRFKFSIEVESNEKLSPKIEAAIERVENGVELIDVDLEKYRALVKSL